jgi:hypothetical protein
MKKNHPCKQLNWKSDFSSIFEGCICDERNCPKKNCIRWEEDNFIHVDFERWLERLKEKKELGITNAQVNLQGKRCDCIIFYSSPKIRKCVVFIVEFKSGSYDLSDVTEKFERTIGILKSLLNDITKVEVYPVLYAKSHSYTEKKALWRLCKVTWLKPTLIRLLNCGDNICRILQNHSNLRN